MRGYLMAVYILGALYHSGQSSKGYARLCQADMFWQRWFPDCNFQKYYDATCGLNTLPKQEWQTFRSEVAFWLKRMRHERKYL